MATNTKQIKPLEIPFKEFMPGQLIVSSQFNDDMNDIEDKVNEQITEYNKLSTELSNHTDDVNNPHQVDAHQTGTYNSDEIDEFVDDLRNGNFNDNAIENRVLSDDCIDTRNYKDSSITPSKVDSFFGSQLDISKNIEITGRYTKQETDELIRTKVGDGTYSKEELDNKFAEVQAGVIVDGTIGVDKLKPNIGDELDISGNASITNRYTKNEVNRLIETNALPRDWGSITETDVVDPSDVLGSLPVADYMISDNFISPASNVLDVDIKEVVDSRNGYYNLNDRLTIHDSQINNIADDLLLEGGKIYLKKHDGTKLGEGALLPVSGGGGNVTWENVTGKPTTFTPSNHNHSKSEIRDFPAIPTKISQLQNDSNFATETFVTTKIEEAQLGSSVVSSIYVKCSDIGMTQNDINNNNHQLLCNAINAGNSILVDGEYVLKTENTKLITKNIDIKGITSSARLVLQFDSFTNGIFKVNGNIDISLKNVKFSSVSSTKIINVVNPIGSLGVIEIDGCKFENKVRIFDFVANGSLNPNQNFYGFDTFIFRKNEVTNPTFTAIAIIDAQYNNVIISDNVIRNLGNLFADISINNESVYSNELPSYRRRTTITNNYIKNDSNYSTNNISGSYYCFVVLESDYVYYARNHVEGLKTLQDVVCYDIYASCKEVVSEDNIWKNNLAVLSSSTQHNFGVALMKAKGNNGSRIYRNNTYILEKSFITGMGKTVNDCKVKLFDNTSNTTWKIINNTIDMARLDGQTSGTAANVEFCNNTLRVSNWGNGTITNSGVGCFNIIKDNNVEIKNIITDFQITGCYVKQSEPVLTNYVVTNNVFDITSSKHLYLYDKVSSAKGEICNNTYRCNIIGDFGINYDAEHCNISNLISYGDKWITNKRPRSIYRQLLDINEYSTVIEFTDVLKQESREHLSLKKMKDISGGFNKTYVWTMEYFTSNGWESSTVNFKLEKNGDISKITFVPLGENVPQSFNLFSTQGNSKKFNFSNNIPYIATLSNNSDNPYIYFNHIAGSESSPKHHIIKHNIKALSGGEVRNSNDIKFWKGSQEAYNRLNTKDNSTLYIIVG